MKSATPFPLIKGPYNASASHHGGSYETDRLSTETGHARSNVADFQEALTLLELTIADAEKTAQRYGASTQQVVSNFQMPQNIPKKWGPKGSPPTQNWATF